MQTFGMTFVGGEILHGPLGPLRGSLNRAAAGLASRASLQNTFDRIRSVNVVHQESEKRDRDQVISAQRCDVA
jgi:hypothetical protein